MILVPLFILGLLLGLSLVHFKFGTSGSTLSSWFKRNIRFSLSSFISLIIHILLLSLGLFVGADPSFFSKIYSWGLIAFCITLGAVGGSFLFAALLERCFVNKKRRYLYQGKKKTKKQATKQGFPNWKSLIGSVSILLCFVAGVLLSQLQLVPTFLIHEKTSSYILLCLIFFVGLQMGKSEDIFSKLKGQPLRYWFLPFCTILGSLVGAGIVGLFLSNQPIRESLAVGSGLAYYSLSSIMIGESLGAGWAAVALLSNIMRELIALVFAPFLARISHLGLISVGGATSMDTTLPVISTFCGQEYVPLSAYHGFLTDLSVPFLVSFFIYF